MSPALFVLVALASPPEGPEPAAAEAPIACRVTVLEMPGLEWRRDLRDRVTRIRRPGAEAVWTAGREVGPTLIHMAARTVHSPQVVGPPGAVPATGEVEATSFRPDRGEDAEASAPPRQSPADDRLRTAVAARRLDQGILAEVLIEDTWVARSHQVEGEGPECTDRVPEFAHARVEGEWLIPADGVLVVSLGAHTTDDDAGKSVVRERLAVIEANPAEEQASCPAEATDARAALPPLPEEVDLAPAPHTGCRESADLDVGVDEAATGPLIVGVGLKDLDGARAVKLADQPARLPVPTPPGRSLPKAFAPDGSPAPSPAKEDDEVKPTAADPSAEPRPSPQARQLKAKAARPVPAGPPPAVPKAPAPADPEKGRPMPLPEAIRIGLENAGCASVLYPGELTARKPAVIAPAGDCDPFRFKAEVMAMVRSIEQQYWALAQQLARRKSKEIAVDLCEAALRREQPKFEVSAGSVPDVAEVKEQLELLRLELVTATADVIVTERQLRNILGLKPVDGLRILPVTAPTEARLTPDWDDCLARMAAGQPDILRSEHRVAMASLQTDPANVLAGAGRDKDETPGAMCGIHPDDPRRGLERRLSTHQQVVHQSTLALARFFREIDANFEQFQAAAHRRQDAQQRLEAAQASYEAGTMPIARYVGAVRDWSATVAREADFKAAYNTSIIALEEAKGTLLAHEHIVVADFGADETPRPKVDDEAKAASPTGPAGDAPKTFTLRLPVNSSTTVQVRISAGWFPAATRAIEQRTR